MLISVRPRQSLPAETEVQAGIGVESPKCVAPIAIGGVVGPLEARGRTWNACLPKRKYRQG